MGKKEIKLELDESLVARIEAALPNGVSMDLVFSSLMGDYVAWLTKHDLFGKLEGRGRGPLERE